MSALKKILAVAVIAFSATSAHAASVHYADSVVSFTQGLCTGSAGDPANVNGCSVNRSDPTEALGAPDDGFVALGDGGELVLGFSAGPFPGGTATVWEVTFNRTKFHKEAVDVYAILGGASTLIGRVLNSVASSSLKVVGAFDSIKLVDATVDEYGAFGVGTSSFDGFDVDAVSVSAVPLPAGGLLLLTGLGGLTFMRRRMKS